MISIVDIFKLVFRYAFEKKGRVFLTISGIIIGIFTFTFFIFLSQGLSSAIASQFTAFGVNVIAIQPATQSVTTGPPSGGGLTDTDVARIKQVISDYKYVGPAIFYSGQFEYSRVKKSFTSIAYQDNIWQKAEADIGVEMAKGRFLRPGDSSVAVIGSKVASAFGTGKNLTIGSTIKANGRSLRIIGIMKPKGSIMIDNAILMPWNDMKIISGQTTYTAIRVSFYDNVNISQMVAKIDQKFNRPNQPKKINITTPSQILAQFNMILGLLTMIISFISSIALIVGGINVMNTMHSNVAERINEISVMKALGGENKDIRKIFLVESSILGFIGAVIGFILAFLLAKGISIFITNNLGYNVFVSFSLQFFIEVVIVTTIFATLFGTYPAIRAAKINPADNLRDE